MEKIRRRENRLNAHLSEILERVGKLKLDNLHDFILFVSFLTLLLSQVNSKGYKVCGEASSVCGTITINKRKVKGLLFNVKFGS